MDLFPFMVQKGKEEEREGRRREGNELEGGGIRPSVLGIQKKSSVERIRPKQKSER